MQRSLKIKSNHWFDLNFIGIAFAVLISVLVLFYHIAIIYKVLIELFLFVTIYTLNRNIKLNQATVIVINSENKWFVEQDGKIFAVEVNDYWLHTKRIFIWLKCSKKSLSIVINRHTIGAERFSQLRAKII